MEGKSEDSQLSSSVLWGHAVPCWLYSHNWSSTLARQAWRGKGELYNFASKMFLSLTLIGAVHAAEIHGSSCFPYQSIFLGCEGQECQLAKKLSNHLTFHCGVLLLSPIKNENLWMRYYLAYLNILLKFPGGWVLVLVFWFFFHGCQLNLNLLTFLCRKMKNASWRVDFQCASFPGGHILGVLNRGEMEWDGTGVNTSLLLCSFKGNVKICSQVMHTILV